MQGGIFPLTWINFAAHPAGAVAIVKLDFNDRPVTCALARKKKRANDREVIRSLLPITA
jgi:hypothetical protein